MHWADFEEENREIRHRLGIHDKAKEIIAEFFIDDIVELNGNSLRLLDYYTYSFSIDPYIQEVYELVHEID